MEWDVYMGEIHDYMDRAVFHDFWCQVAIAALLKTMQAWDDAPYLSLMHWI